MLANPHIDQNSMNVLKYNNKIKKMKEGYIEYIRENNITLLYNKLHKYRHTYTHTYTHTRKHTKFTKYVYIINLHIHRHKQSKRCQCLLIDNIINALFSISLKGVSRAL